MPLVARRKKRWMPWPLGSGTWRALLKLQRQRYVQLSVLILGASLQLTPRTRPATQANQTQREFSIVQERVTQLENGAGIASTTTANVHPV